MKCIHDTTAIDCSRCEKASKINRQDISWKPFTNDEITHEKEYYGRSVIGHSKENKKVLEL